MNWYPSLEEFIRTELRVRVRQRSSRMPLFVPEDFVYKCIAKWLKLSSVKRVLATSQREAGKPARHEYIPALEHPDSRFYKEAAKIFDLDASGTGFRNPFLERRCEPEPSRKDDTKLSYPGDVHSGQKRMRDDVIDAAVPDKRFRTDIVVGMTFVDNPVNIDSILSEAMEQRMLNVVRDYWARGLDQLASPSSVQPAEEFAMSSFEPAEDSVQDHPTVADNSVLGESSLSSNTTPNLDYDSESSFSDVGPLLAHEEDDEGDGSSSSSLDLGQVSPFDVEQREIAFSDENGMRDFYFSIHNWLSDVTFDADDHITRGSMSDYSGKKSVASDTSETPLLRTGHVRYSACNEGNPWKTSRDETSGRGILRHVSCSLKSGMGRAAGLVMKCVGRRR